MKTVFRITADTKKMTVHSEVRQGGRLMWVKRYPTISDALVDMLNGIGTVMAKRADKEIDHDQLEA